MDASESHSKRNRIGRARARQMARHRNNQPMVVMRENGEQVYRATVPATVYDDTTPTPQERARLLLGEAWWHVRNRAIFWRFGVVLFVGLFGFFILSHLLTGKIFPNINALNVNLGGMTVPEAQTALLEAWVNHTQIQLIDGDRVWNVSTLALGLQLDATATAEAAKGAGLSGLIFGHTVEPVITVDQDTLQNYLLTMAEDTSLPAYNPGYAWRGDELVGVAGHAGRLLNVAATVAYIQQDPGGIARRGRLFLQMNSIPPESVDPLPYLAQAQEFATQPMIFNGYDPFTDEHVSWTTDRDTITSWLEVGTDGLTLREETFGPFIQAQNQAVAASNQERFFEINETMNKMRDAIRLNKHEVDLRIRYRATPYEVERGDTAFGIARRTGIPMFLLEEANPGRDLAVLFPGDTINLPSRDVTVPLDPIPNKRIIVDLNTQSLRAYENGQEVFHWLISSGIDSAPTAPGIYQILSHDELAYGSSYTLCSAQGCGQWEMQYFMGIYEVVPGLVNGFHGAVTLPNGTYLGGGNVGRPYTFGCVMSTAEDAPLLYNWADEGTVVEIISNEFAPESDLARQAFPV